MIDNIPLFRFTQIRDLNDPDITPLRARQVPLFFGFEDEDPLETLRGRTRLLDLRKIEEHVRSKDFEARAEVVQDLYLLSKGRDTRKISPEFTSLLQMLNIANSVAQCLRNGDKGLQDELSRLINLWQSTVDLPTEAREIFTDVALKDLASLYLVPLNYMDYRRLLAALRRVSYVRDQFQQNAIVEDLSQLLDKQEKSQLGGPADILFASRILIAPNTFKAEPPVRTKGPIPRTESLANMVFQRGPITEILANSAQLADKPVTKTNTEK